MLAAAAGHAVQIHNRAIHQRLLSVGEEDVYLHHIKRFFELERDPRDAAVYTAGPKTARRVLQGDHGEIIPSENMNQSITVWARPATGQATE